MADEGVLPDLTLLIGLLAVLLAATGALLAVIACTVGGATPAVLAVGRAEVIGPLAVAGKVGGEAVEAAAEALGVFRRQVYIVGCLFQRWRVCWWRGPRVPTPQRISVRDTRSIVPAAWRTPSGFS